MTTTTESAEEFSFLDMSDEDLAKYSPDNLPPGIQVPEESQESSDEDPVDTESASDAPDTQDADDEEAAPTAAASSEPAGDATALAAPHAAAASAAKTPEPDKGAEAEKPAAPATEINYEAEYRRLIGTTFKANGRDISVSSVEDAIQLMQMGANYSKKMAGLKPNLTLLKMLENNGLLSEEKLSFLIDLSKKDTGAINKLVKDSGIDPMDLNVEKAGDYKPGSHQVDEREIELDAVLDEIQTTPSYERTINIVGKQWDPASKQAIANEPQLLKVINSHVQNGIYDLIVTELERERMLGRLQGLSDLAAYRQVGDAIQARGGFNHLGRQGQSNRPAPGQVVSPKSVQGGEDKLKEKRRAAASAKPVTSSTTTPAADFNPLALSDEEFAKLAKTKYL